MGRRTCGPVWIWHIPLPEKDCLTYVSHVYIRRKCMSGHGCGWDTAVYKR
ncbi:hypothetical protein MMALV_13360 [Candidatus Methanomethylophilus alvi Mx1201]|uniref:Uncharacterized protein n=1 Tax=Methanomethylophilus alvi (strain Mx1201) TaxID=1236689 RepID=M9SF70_METAX|nr:hypothetical protein MMALV_13360 [Candidatus Methanomethylophilus alvi Mx1201]